MPRAGQASWRVCGWIRAQLSVCAAFSTQTRIWGRLFALVVCLSTMVWNAKMESRWPGIFYVAASRVKELAAFALKEPFSTTDATTDALELAKPRWSHGDGVILIR